MHTSTPVIIHRDLKSLNLLIDDRWGVKISDFGLSRFKVGRARQAGAAAPACRSRPSRGGAQATSTQGLMTAQCGTFYWMAPEVIGGQAYTEKADVYSFGVNLWELLTRATPFGGEAPMTVACVAPPPPPTHTHARRRRARVTQLCRAAPR